MATTSIIPQNPTQADPAVVALMNGMKMQEGGGKIDYNAIGDQGTAAGAGQWSNQPNGKPVPLAQGQIPSNFISEAKQYGLDPTDFSPENQNKVLYAEIATGKQAGLSPEQILSQHNSGEPNKYLSTNSSGNGPVGAYNVASYVQKAMGYAQKYAQANTAYASGGQDTTQTPPQTPASPVAPSVSGFIGNAVNSAGTLLGGLGNALMHPINTVTNLASTVAGAGESATNALGITHINNQDTQNFGNLVSNYAQKYGGNSIDEVVQNIGKTLYTDPVGAALDLSTVLDGAGAALGAAGKVADVAKATELANTSDFISTANGILKSGDPAAIKALQTPGTLTKIANAVQTAAQYTNPIAPVAGAISGTFNKLSDLTEAIPRRIINNLLPQLKNPETIDYATSNLKLGSVDSMVTASQASLDSYNASIKSILTHPDYANAAVSGTDIIQKTLQQFPNSEYTPETIIAKIKSQIPGTAALVTKLQDGSLSLDEANTLRQSIDKVTYKTAIDSPEVRAGKELAQAFGNSLRSNVQELAPETKPIFSNYSKEINLQKALQKLSLKEGRAGAISMRELITALGATGFAGPVAGVGTLVAEKIVDSPMARVGLAKALKNTAVPIAKAVVKGVSKTTPFLKEAAMAERVNNATRK